MDLIMFTDEAFLLIIGLTTIISLLIGLVWDADGISNTLVKYSFIVDGAYGFYILLIFFGAGMPEMINLNTYLYCNLAFFALAALTWSKKGKLNISIKLIFLIATLLLGALVAFI